MTEPKIEPWMDDAIDLTPFRPDRDDTLKAIAEAHAPQAAKVQKLAEAVENHIESRGCYCGELEVECDTCELQKALKEWRGE